MTTMAAEAPVWSIDLVGRPAVVNHEMTTVTALRGTEVFTALEPGIGREAESVVMLPVTGEFVEIAEVMPSREAVKGYWLGPVESGGRVHETFSVLVLSESKVQRLVMPVAKADARQLVKGRASEGERAAMGALLTEARAHNCTRRDHEAWRDRLVSEAHSEADDRQWCGEFDDFMDRVGLPRRSREYDLEVEVSATVRVTLTATSEEEATDALTREDVWAALGEDNITWDVSEVYDD